MNITDYAKAEALNLRNDAGHYAPERRAVVTALAAAGIAGPAVFTALVIAQALLHPAYSHVTRPVSELAAWPGGWVQNVNFFLFGLLTTAFAIGLHLGVRPARGGVLGPALFVLSGVGLVVAGGFPLSTSDGAVVIPVGHLVGTVLAFLGAGSGFVVLSRRLLGDARWRGLATYAFASGVAVIVLFFVAVTLAGGSDAPLYPWVGLVQRLPMVVWFSCEAVLAIKLLQLTGTTGLHGRASGA